MKNIVIGVAAAIVLVLLLFCIYTLQGDATRKTESSDSITQAMENAAAKMTEDEEVYTGNEEFRTAFVQNLMLQLDSASDVKVKILMSDYQKGLIQAEVTQHYKTPRGGIHETKSGCKIISRNLMYCHHGRKHPAGYGGGICKGKSGGDSGNSHTGRNIGYR